MPTATHSRTHKTPARPQVALKTTAAKKKKSPDAAPGDIDDAIRMGEISRDEKQAAPEKKRWSWRFWR